MTLINQSTVFLTANGNGRNRQSAALVHRLVKQLDTWNVKLSNHVVETLLQCTPNKIRRVGSVMLQQYATALNQPYNSTWEVGMGGNYNFQDYVLQILHYVGVVNSTDDNPRYSERFIWTDQIVVRLASENSARFVLDGILGSSVLPSKQQVRVAAGLCRELGIVAPSTRYESIKIGVARQIAFPVGTDNVDNKAVLRAINALSQMEAKPISYLRFLVIDPDREDFRYISLANSVRKALLGVFSTDFDFPYLAEAMSVNQVYWNKFAKVVHPQQPAFAKRYRVAVAALASTRNMNYRAFLPPVQQVINRNRHMIDINPDGKLLYRSWASRLESNLENNQSAALNMLESRPGYLLRNLQSIGNKLAKAHIARFTKMVNKALPVASMNQLLSLAGTNWDTNTRIVKAGMSNRVVEVGYPEWMKHIGEYATGVLVDRLPKFKHIAYPRAIANTIPGFMSSQSELAAGSIYDFGGRFLNMFMTWQQSSKGVDLDRTLLYLDSNYNVIREHGYRHPAPMMSNGKIYSNLSPDEIYAEKPTSEMAIVDLENLPSGVAYIAFGIISYSSVNFRDLKKFEIGWCASDNTAGFTLTNDVTKFSVIRNGLVYVPFVLNAVNHTIMAVDVTFETRHRELGQVSSQVVQAIKSANPHPYTMNVARLASLMTDPYATESLVITDANDLAKYIN